MSKVEVTYLSSLTEGSIISSAYYVAEVFEKMTRDKRPYCDVHVRDKTGAKVARYWGPAADLPTFSFAEISGRTEMYMDNVQLVIDSCKELESSDVDLEDFTCKIDNYDTFTEFFETILDEVTDPTLLAIYKKIFSKSFKEKFFDCPAGTGLETGQVGGALLQACRLVNAVNEASRLHHLDQLTKDLLVVGSILAFSGKPSCYDHVDCMPMQTVKGKLYGETASAYQRLVLALVMLKQKPTEARKLAKKEDDEDWQLDEEVILRLSHMLLSARSTSFESYTYHPGAVQPCSVEAMILSHCLRTQENITSALECVVSSNLADNNPNDLMTPFDTKTRRNYLKNNDLQL